MTKQPYILLLALIFSSFSMAQGEVDRTDFSYQQWNDSLKTFLLNHPHPYVQTIGLNLSHLEQPLVSDVDNHFKLNDEQQNYVDHINHLVNRDTLSAETIFLLISLCSNNAIHDACHHQSLINKYQRLYPDDLYAYLEPFYRAVNNDDVSMAEYLIKNMRDAKYTTDMTILPKVLKSAIKDYMDKHPIPRSVLIKQLKDLVDIDDSVSNKELNQAFYYIQINGIKMALPIPAYKSLLDYCSSKSSPTQACVEIADTLITQGNEIISQLIGHRLKVNSYESSLETDLLVKAEETNNQFRSFYDCIQNSLSKNLKMADYRDMEYAKLWFTDDNEIQRIKSAANYLYKKGQKAGFTDVKDPTKCEQPPVVS